MTIVLNELACRLLMKVHPSRGCDVKKDNGLYDCQTADGIGFSDRRGCRAI